MFGPGARGSWHSIDCRNTMACLSVNMVNNMPHPDSWQQPILRRAPHHLSVSVDTMGKLAAKKTNTGLFRHRCVPINHHRLGKSLRAAYNKNCCKLYFKSKVPPPPLASNVLKTQSQLQHHTIIVITPHMHA